MRDVGYLLMVIVFFVIAAAYVRACASVVGEPSAELDEPGGDEELAA